MMTLNNITKIREGLYNVTSKPCPKCGETLTIELDSSLLFRYNQGHFIQDVLPHLSADDRERFQSGYCALCWNDLFPAEDDDNEENH